MSNWLEQYSSALSERDTREKANKPYIDAYTKLADRTAAAPAPTLSQPTKPPTTTETSTRVPTTSTPDEDLTLLRTQLAHTQSARSTLQSHLTSLTTRLSSLQTAQTHSGTRISTLQAQITTLERQVRDRDDELRAKSKMLRDAQDELVVLELQVNVAEEGRGKAEELAGELTRRWNEKKEGEVRRMNEEGGF
ncbi:hypothetical protein MBLNU230_g4541t1 [Neophaeotheca triangularis]